MQHSLTTFLDRKKRSDAKPAVSVATNQRPASRLVQALQSQLVRAEHSRPERASGRQQQGQQHPSPILAAVALVSKKEAGLSTAEGSSQADKPHLASKLPDRLQQLCPVDSFEAHLQRELAMLDDSDNGSERPQQQPQQQRLWHQIQHEQQQQHGQEAARTEACHTTRHLPGRAPLPKRQRVLVLGGQPQATASTDAEALQQRQQQRVQQRRRELAQLTVYNHYADGKGFWEGEDIGIDGCESAGLAWEGMGTTSHV
ncbi:hypothetical protein N2152v2_005545 [Parachlorella kessleri]